MVQPVDCWQASWLEPNNNNRRSGVGLLAICGGIAVAIVPLETPFVQKNSVNKPSRTAANPLSEDVRHAKTG
jgi:hypothetical protein